MTGQKITIREVTPQASATLVIAEDANTWTVGCAVDVCPNVIRVAKESRRPENFAAAMAAKDYLFERCDVIVERLTAPAARVCAGCVR